MDREAIEKELAQFPGEWAAAFAARCAAQCLPALLEKKDPTDSWFAYWPDKKRDQYLFAVFRANSVASAVTGVASSAYINTAFNAAIDAADASVYASYADASAYAAFSASAVLDSFDTSASAVNITANVTGLDISQQLALLRKACNSQGSFTDYLFQPLWQPGEEWYERAKEFVQVLREYGSGFDFWADWYEDRLEGRAPDKDLLDAIANLSYEQLTQEPAQINAYLKSLVHKEDLAESSLNRVRVIFLGYGATGKTSLIRVLNNKKVVEGKEPMTAGIDILDWKVPDSDITAHFWDFGGQVMTHATHQFFLRSKCLYILVLDGRTEINANEQAEYWLDHVRAFGRDAPVMLIGNKADLCPVNLDMARLRDKHPNVTDFYPLSCTQYRGNYAPHFQRFRADLLQQILAVGMHGIRFLKPHFTVLQELISRSGRDSFLRKSAYENLCKDKGVAKQGDLNRDWLLDLLDKLGVVLHFPDIADLDSLILNPRWLTYGVYRLLYSEAAQQAKGRLKEQEVISILSRREVDDNLGNPLSYTPDKAGIVIKAMERFRLCFRCRLDPDLLIIPALLETDQPAHGFIKADSLCFSFAFQGFLPRHVLPNFTVARHDEIADEMVWQNGVVLRAEDGRAEALVQADYHERSLTLWVRGPQAGQYFRYLHQDICRILRRMPDLRFREWVTVPESTRIKEEATDFPLRSGNNGDSPARADFRQLLAMEARGQREYICEYGAFDLHCILQIMPAPARQSYRQEMHGRAEVYYVQQTINGDNNTLSATGEVTHSSVRAGGNMGHTYKNTITNSGSGEQNIAQGDGAIGKQVNISETNAPQAPVEDLLKLLTEIKARLPELPDKAQIKLRNAVEEVEMEVQEDKPDREEIADTLTRAQKVLKAIPGTVAAAQSVGVLLGKALIWCGKAAGMS
ncbi:MAG: COR domain-containing protein [Candidatus Electrothrix sp. GW3-4]|uniref:COR domain-containing protein n=1 Tax=Candidatus Electrothrix sp. GW3-4 TaxID=3126740 RepID=UPI0030D23659